MGGQITPALYSNKKSITGSSDPLTYRDFLPLAINALILRLVIGPWFGHSGDMNTFISWAIRLADIGPANFFNNQYWCDYLPGYLYVLWPLGELANLLPDTLQIILFKLPNILADIATAYIIWQLLKPTRKNNMLWVAAIYLFNPAVLINSTLWGQADSFHTLCLVIALALLVRRRPEWSAVMFGFSAAVKLHAIVFLPLAAVYAFKTRIPWYRIVAALLIVCAVFLATFLPFNNFSITTLPDFVTDRITTTMGQYHYASVNALNLWYLAGQNFKPDDTILSEWLKIPHLGTILSAVYNKNFNFDNTQLFRPLNIHHVGTILFAVCYAVALCWYWIRRKSPDNRALWESASIVILATFCFVTRAHERHLFSYFAIVALAAGWGRGAMVPFSIISLTYTLNMILSWLWLKPTFETAHICHPILAGIICIVNLACLPLSMVMFTQTGDHFAGKWHWQFIQWRLKKYTPLQPDTTWIRQHRRILLAIIILLALATRVVRLNTPPERYHDEVYHAYTAEQWVRGNTDAWLWDKSAPNPNCAYEWTHPPLAKLLMTASMGVFGIHPWAWRLPAALLGTLCAALVYWIARNLFERESIALLAAALYSLDTLPLVMSRVGMNDIYCVTFVLVAVLAALRHRYFLSAMSVGAALACKWSALYALPLLALIYLIRPHPRYRRHLGYLTSVCIIHVLAIVGIYMAAYIPFFKAGHSIDQFCDLQEQMWFYHTGLTATHPGSSPAWAWPLNRGALWLYTSKTVNPKANIYAVGSPIIWFAGLLAVLFSAYQLIQKPNHSLGVVLAGYLFFWAPWLMSPRIMFINHYLPSLPFLYIALAHAVVDRKLSITNIICLLSLAVLCLVVFFPYITACPLPAILSPLNIQQQISAFFSISRPT